MKTTADTNQRIAKNNAYYSRFAEKAAERTENRNFDKAFEHFLDNINKGDLILDIGSGAGIHLKYFKDHGYNAIGIEPSEKMRDLASAAGVKSIDGTFESIDSLNFKDVSGVWCAASLLHVPKEEMPSSIAKVASILKSGGTIYITVRLGDGAKWDKFDDQSGDAERFIQLYSEDEIKNTLENAGFEIQNSWTEDSYWGRPSKWISVISKKL